MSIATRLVRIACILGLAVCAILLLAPGATSQQPRPRTPPPRPPVVRSMPPRPQPAPAVANTQQGTFNGMNAANTFGGTTTFNPNLGGVPFNGGFGNGFNGGFPVGQLGG